MMPAIILIKHSLYQEVKCQQDIWHIKIYSHNGFRHVYQESSYLQKNVIIGKQTQKFHLLVKNIKIMVTALSLFDFRLPPNVFFYQAMKNKKTTTQTQKL